MNKINKKEKEQIKPLILVVDDNEEMRLYIQALLDETFTILIAENG